MWRTDTHWFDVAIVMTIFAFGNALFGRFEEHRPRSRRALKIVICLALFVGLSAVAGRAWMYGLLGVSLLAVLAVHGWWLPRNGVDGWTAEPRERYYALLGLDAEGRPR
jgi:hypothetical protein